MRALLHDPYHRVEDVWVDLEAQTEGTQDLLPNTVCLEDVEMGTWRCYRRTWSWAGVERGDPCPTCSRVVLGWTQDGQAALYELRAGLVPFGREWEA